jgi:hypothetical protein
VRCTPGAVLARPLHDLKDPNEFEPREQDQAAQTAGLARTAPIGLWAPFRGGRVSGRGGAGVCAGLQGYRPAVDPSADWGSRFTKLGPDPRIHEQNQGPLGAR